MLERIKAGVVVVMLFGWSGVALGQSIVLPDSKTPAPLLGGYVMGEADPTKAAKSPWPLDQRCAIMAAHLYNQPGFPDQCLGGMWPGKIEIGPQRSVFPSQQNMIQNHSQEPKRGGGPEDRQRL